MRPWCSGRKGRWDSTSGNNDSEEFAKDFVDGWLGNDPVGRLFLRLIR